MHKKYLKSLFALIIIFCFNVFATVAYAVSDYDTKMFSASGVRVDVTADNAANAREKALEDGQQRALMVVMERITPDYIIEQLPELIPDDIIDFVQDMSVSNEKTSTVRYMATLEVRFNPEAVQELLKQNGIPYVRTASRPLLVLPVYKKSLFAKPVLWGEENIWLSAWINRKTESFMAPISVPVGDLSDIEMLEVSDITNGNLAAAESLAKRYEADGIISVEIVKNGNDFKVKGTALDELTASEVPAFSFNVSMTKNTKYTLDMAVKKVIEHLESVWKNEQMAQFNESASLIAMAPVNDLAQWEEIKQRLDRIPLISSYDLQAARAGVLQLTIFFAEQIERLQKEMNKKRLSLTVLPSGVFKLEMVEQVNYSQSFEGVSNADEMSQTQPYSNEQQYSY